MSLIQSAKLNGHQPYAYLSDVLDRLSTQPASRVAELLPYRWAPSAAWSATAVKTGVIVRPRPSLTA